MKLWVRSRFRPFRRFLLVLFALPILSAALPAPAETVRLLAPRAQFPIAFTNVQGVAEGFAIDVMKAVCRLTGDELAIDIKTWRDSCEALANGTADAVAVCRNPSRPGLVPSIPYASTQLVLVEPVPAATPPAHTNPCLGVMQESVAANWLRTHPQAWVTIILPDFMELTQALQSGRVARVILPYLLAADVVNRSDGRFQISRTPLPDGREDLRFAVQNGKGALLERINDGMATLQASGEFRRIHARWFSQPQAARRWQTVIVGGDRAFPPFEYLDDKGRPSGCLVELTQAGARASGVKAVIQLGEWAERQRALLDGRVDILEDVVYTEERAKRMAFSQPHYVLRYVAVTRANDKRRFDDVSDLSDRVVAAEAGGLVAQEACKYVPGATLDVVPTLDDALSLVNAGQADCVLAPRAIAIDFFMRRPQWRSTLKISSHTLFSAELCYAVRPGNEALLAAIDTVLLELKTSGVMHRIMRNHIKDYNDAPSFGRILMDHWAVAAGILLLIATLAVLVVLLRRLVLRQGAFQRQLLHCCPVALFACDLKGHVTLWNPACGHLFGFHREEVLGRPNPAIPPDGRAAFVTYCRHPVPLLSNRYTMIDKEGQPICVRFQVLPILGEHGRVAGIIAAAEDMRALDQAQAERSKMEERMQNAQKMEAVGQLAGGVAHDFNNVLQVIIGYTELMLDPEDHPDVKELRDDAMKVFDAASRAKALVSQLLAFSRRQVLRLHDLDLNSEITGMAALLHQAAGPLVDLSFDYGHDLGAISADSSQLGQVLMNLCVNARDAMPGGGRLVVATANVMREFTAPGAEQAHPLGIEAAAPPPGRYVQLSVTDSGTGIPPDLLKRIFDPFFTTKERGKGTGLGLSTVYGIVRQHQGFIAVHSTVGKGTTFNILFPVVSGAKTPTVTPRPHAPGRPGGHPCTETLLLAEDEPSVRKFAKDILERAGYTVIAAKDGEEAIRFFDRFKDKIDASILDVIMPHRNGREVYDHIKAARPDAIIVFTSGYTAATLQQDFSLSPDINLVSKPYEPGRLLDRLRQALDAGRPA